MGFDGNQLLTDWIYNWMYRRIKQGKSCGFSARESTASSAKNWQDWDDPQKHQAFSGSHHKPPKRNKKVGFHPENHWRTWYMVRF